MSMLVARDAVAVDQLVYVYPFTLGPQVEVSCGDEEVVVMCPAWAVSGLLGPGRHQWTSPEPTKPLAVYFVLTGPVEVPFDMVAQFPIPTSGAQASIRASGSVLVRVSDPGLLVAQFVGLPFDNVNDGLMSSVAGSVERMLGKVLPRKVAAAGTIRVVTDDTVQAALAEELAAYNPACGAVFGVEFVRFAGLQVTHVGANLEPQAVSGWIGGNGPSAPDGANRAPGNHEPQSGNLEPQSGWIGGSGPSVPASATNLEPRAGSLEPQSGWIGGGPDAPGEDADASDELMATVDDDAGAPPSAVSGEIQVKVPRKRTTQPPESATPDADAAAPMTASEAPTPSTPELPIFSVGTRVLVALADGLLHAGTVLSSMQGYYELDIGGADQPLWVPGNQITPQL